MHSARATWPLSGTGKRLNCTRANDRAAGARTDRALRQGAEAHGLLGALQLLIWLLLVALYVPKSPLHLGAYRLAHGVVVSPRAQQPVRGDWLVPHSRRRCSVASGPRLAPGGRTLVLRCALGRRHLEALARRRVIQSDHAFFSKR